MSGGLRDDVRCWSVYMLYDPDGEPFYIGSTSNIVQRILHHDCDARYGRIQKIAAVRIAFTGCRRDAFDRETELIDQFQPPLNQQGTRAGKAHQAEQTRLAAGRRRQRASTSDTRTRGDLLCRLREHAGLSLRELAERADVDPGVISRAERGHRNLSLYATLRIARVFGVTPEALTEIDGEDARPVQPVQRPAGAA